MHTVSRVSSRTAWLWRIYCTGRTYLYAPAANSARSLYRGSESVADETWTNFVFFFFLSRGPLNPPIFLFSVCFSFDASRPAPYRPYRSRFASTAPRKTYRTTAAAVCRGPPNADGGDNDVGRVGGRVARLRPRVSTVDVWECDGRRGRL